VASAFPDEVARAALAEPGPSPQLASLLLDGIHLAPAALDRALRALGEALPDLGEEGRDALYWVGFSCWVVAAALVGDAARRRLARQPVPALALLTEGPP
jgi:hypothetical protein